MLGFGEGEGREIDKREERQGFVFWRKKKTGFGLIGFWKRFCLHFFYFFGFRKGFFFGFFFFFKYCADVENCGSFRGFGYIYIYIERERD